MNKGKFTIYVLLLGALGLVLTGCNSKKEETSQAPAALPTKTVDPTTVGEVSGTVRLDGTPPKMRAINMAAEPMCARMHPTPLISEEVVTGDGGALANVVVYIKTGLEDYSFPLPSGQVKLDQRGCQYQPHVIALRTGQMVSVINDDQTTHNIHPIPTNNREWNESQPPEAPPIEKSFTREDVAFPIKCNVHPWMKAYVAVVANPYFQVTGKDGAFDLKNLPPGTYTLVAWHELYGISVQPVTIGPKESKTVTFKFNAASVAGD